MTPWNCRGGGVFGVQVGGFRSPDMTANSSMSLLGQLALDAGAVAELQLGEGAVAQHADGLRGVVHAWSFLFARGERRMWWSGVPASA